MNTLNEQTALQNFATKFGMIVNIRTPEDKRKNETYFLSLNGTTISPCFDYMQMNGFLLGWNSCNENQETNNSVMGCSVSELKKTVLKTLCLCDDYQQISSDKNDDEILTFFVDSYNELESIYFEFKNADVVSSITRNRIRMMLKEINKMIVICN